MDSLLLKPVEAADKLRISRSKAYELIAQGVIPSIRVGGSVRVPLDALRGWIAHELQQRSELDSTR